MARGRIARACTGDGGGMPRGPGDGHDGAGSRTRRRLRTLLLRSGDRVFGRAHVGPLSRRDARDRSRVPHLDARLQRDAAAGSSRPFAPGRLHAGGTDDGPGDLRRLPRLAADDRSALPHAARTSRAGDGQHAAGGAESTEWRGGRPRRRRDDRRERAPHRSSRAELDVVRAYPVRNGGRERDLGPGATPRARTRTRDDHTGQARRPGDLGRRLEPNDDDRRRGTGVRRRASGDPGRRCGTLAAATFARGRRLAGRDRAVSDVDRARRVLLKRMRYMARRLTKPRIVRIGRVLLEVDDPAVSPAMRDEIYSERYESRELRLLGDLVKPSDNVMEIGAGLGYLASWYGRVAPRILLVEANPYLIPLIRRNLRANGVAAEVVHGVLGPSNGKRTLHLSADFWDASLIPTDKHTASVEIDQLDAGEMFSRFSPTFLIIDIEGGEAELLPLVPLETVHKILIEFHPQVVGSATITELIRLVIDRGFLLDTGLCSDQVFFFHRPAAVEHPERLSAT